MGASCSVNDIHDRLNFESFDSLWQEYSHAFDATRVSSAELFELLKDRDGLVKKKMLFALVQNVKYRGQSDIDLDFIRNFCLQHLAGVGETRTSISGRVRVTVIGPGHDVGRLDSPIGVCLSEESEELYVVDFGNNQIQVFDALTGNPIRSFHEKKLNKPMGICILVNKRKDQITRELLQMKNSDDKSVSFCFITEHGENTVQVFSSQGFRVRTIGSGTGKLNGEFSLPRFPILQSRKVEGQNSTSATLLVQDAEELAAGDLTNNMVLKVDNLSCSDLLDKSSYFTTQEPCLCITLDKAVHSTAKLFDAVGTNTATKCVFPEIFDIALNSKQYMEGKLIIEVFQRNKKNEISALTHLGIGELVIKKTVPKFENEVEVVVPLIHKESNNAEKPGGEVKLRIVLKGQKSAFYQRKREALIKQLDKIEHFLYVSDGNNNRVQVLTD